MAESGRVLSALEEYQHFLMGLDIWFRSIRVKYGARMHCSKGCILCCCGLFDIPLPDAFRVAAGYKQLSPSSRNGVLQRARLIQSNLLQEVPDLIEPFSLDRITQDRIDRLTDLFDAVRCPFLTAEDECLIYEYRPSACILEGIPMVDSRDGPFDDWCEFNFTGGINREVEKDLRLDYYEIEETIRRVSENLAARMPYPHPIETTMFIPSVVVSFESFWQNLLREQS